MISTGPGPAAQDMRTGFDAEHWALCIFVIAACVKQHVCADGAPSVVGGGSIGVLWRALAGQQGRELSGAQRGGARVLGVIGLAQVLVC